MVGVGFLLASEVLGNPKAECVGQGTLTAY